MSDTPPSVDQKESVSVPGNPKKQNPIVTALKENPRARHMVAYSIMVFLVLFTIWTGGLRANGARAEALEQGVNALAASLIPLTLERDPIKIERALAKISSEGGFRYVTLSDTKGGVLASTDATQRGKRISEMERAPTRAQHFSSPTGPVIRRKIFLADDNPTGAVEVGLP